MTGLTRKVRRLRPRRESLTSLVVSVSIGLGVFAAVWFARRLGWLQPLELKCYDVLVRRRPTDVSMASHVVIVGMGEDDYYPRERANGAIERPRISQPMADSEMAQVLKNILACKPRAVGVDIFRDRLVGTNIPGEDYLPDDRKSGRDALRQIWTSHKNVIFGALYDDKRGIVKGGPGGLPPKQVGLADLLVDKSDAVVRRGSIPFLIDLKGDTRGGKRLVSPLAFRLAKLYLDAEPGPVTFEFKTAQASGKIWVEGWIGKEHLAPLQLPFGAYRSSADQGTQFLYDFRTRPEFFARLDATRVITGDFDPEVFRDKVVLLGITAPEIKDYLATPLMPDTFGTDVHAMAVEQLLRVATNRSRLTRVWSPRGETAWVLIWCVLGALLGFQTRSIWRFAVVAVAGTALLFVWVDAAFSRGLWLPVLPPAVGWLFAAGLVTAYVSYHERHNRAAVMRLFSRHVSPEVAETLWQERDTFLKKGRLQARPLLATVLFTDLKDFSIVSERLDAPELMEWLNEFMGCMSQAVEENGGVVNKYIGDSIMAVFGAPVPSTTSEEQRRDARASVRCALRMRQTLGELKARWVRDGKPVVDMRVGIYTGRLVAGSLGSMERVEYTVVGDTVNTASRLESYDKNVMDASFSGNGCRILIGQSTLDLIGNEFPTRYIGLIALRGKEHKVEIYGVLDPGSRSDEDDDSSPAAKDATPGSTVVTS